MPDKPKPPPPTPEQLEKMKAALIADPNTKKIAETVKMPFNEYVEQVMRYLANPSLEPQVYVAEDADLRAAGFEPVDARKVAAYFQEHADAQEVSGVTGSKFADPNSQRERVSGKIPAAPPATAKPEEVRKDLKEALERERSSGKFRKF
jgi:hypothetical protein